MAMECSTFVNEKGETIFFGGDYAGPVCEQNMGQYLLDAMAKNSEKVAQINVVTDETYTHGYVRKMSIRCALEIRKSGIKQGDLVGIISKSGNMDITIPYLAAVYLGCPLIPMHPDYSHNELLRIFGLTEPKIIFCEPESLEVLQGLMKELKLNPIVIVFNQDFDRFIAERIDPNEQIEEAKFKAVKLDPFNSILVILCTSGTTGLVKGVTITHAKVYDSQYIFRHLMKAEDCLLLYSPISWVTFTWALVTVCNRGSTRLVLEYDPEFHIKTCAKYKQKWVFLTPAKLFEMVNHPTFKEYPEIVDNLEFLLVGGSYCSPEHMLKYEKLFKNAQLYNGYGSTELFGFHAYFDPVLEKDLLRMKIPSHGRVPAGCSWKLLDPDTKKSVGVNAVGELCIKSPMICGYYKEPDATKQAVDSDGYFHSGDLGYVDDDGCLYINGRSKELFKYKGWQVTPAELVLVLRTHPAIYDACVMGKPHPVDGDLPLAFVVKKPNNENVTEAEIIAYVDSRVADSQKLRGGVIFLDSLPMTPTGKVKSKDLKPLIPV